MVYHYIVARVDDKISARPAQKNTKDLFCNLLKTFSAEAVVTRELGKKRKKGEAAGKKHYHAQLGVESKIKAKSLKEKLRDLMTEKIGCFGDEFMVASNKKDKTAHISYIFKDGDVVMNTWIDQEEYEATKKESERINAEKDMKMKHQILGMISQMKDNHLFGNNPAVNVELIYMSTMEYHVDRDYLPPSRTLLTQYAAYCVIKLFKDYTCYSMMIDHIYNL